MHALRETLAQAETVRAAIGHFNVADFASFLSNPRCLSPVCDTVKGNR
jgi:hypothetical protein